MQRPLILLTNDDGIASPYLAILAETMCDSLGAEVLCVAPESQQSAMSHSITLHKPLRIVEVAPGMYSVSGTPVDCVYIGVMKLAKRLPDLVVSGPNDGFNLGTDVFYSGTVGAAVEGALRGIPSIALSVGSNSPEAVPDAALLTCELAAKVLADGLPSTTVLNVNVPAKCDGKMRWTSLGKRFYKDDVQERHDPRGRKYYWIGGGLAGIEDIAGSDCEACIDQGIASVTPLQLQLTSTGLLKEQQKSWRLASFQTE